MTSMYISVSTCRLELIMGVRTMFEPVRHASHNVPTLRDIRVNM